MNATIIRFTGTTVLSIAALTGTVGHASADGSSTSGNYLLTAVEHHATGPAAPQPLAFELDDLLAGPIVGTLIGSAIGDHANDGDEAAKPKTSGLTASQCLPPGSSKPVRC